MQNTKPMRELVQGDKIKVEYIDFGNWLTITVDYIERHNGIIGCKVVGITSDGKPFEGWGCEADEVDLVHE